MRDNCPPLAEAIVFGQKRKVGWVLAKHVTAPNSTELALVIDGGSTIPVKAMNRGADDLSRSKIVRICNVSYENGVWLIDGVSIWESVLRDKTGFKLAFMALSELLDSELSGRTDGLFLNHLKACGIEPPRNLVFLESEFPCVEDMKKYASLIVFVAGCRLNIGDGVGIDLPVVLSTRLASKSTADFSPHFAPDFSSAVLFNGGRQEVVSISEELRKMIKKIVDTGVVSVGRKTLHCKDLCRGESENYRPDKLLIPATAMKLQGAGLLGKDSTGHKDAAYWVKTP